MTNAIPSIEESPTVFVVDDDPEVRISVEQLFATVDLAVQTFESAEEFLASGPNQNLGCVVLDLRMPGMGGMELLRQLVVDEQHMPIIMVTAHADVSKAVQALRLGAFDFVEKPYRPEKLIQKTRQALAFDAKQREALSRRQTEEDTAQQLSPDEALLISLLADGQPECEVASQLSIPEKELDCKLAEICDRLGLDSTADLLRLVVYL